MRVILIGGTHPRHLHYLNAVANHPAVTVVGAILEDRGPLLPDKQDKPGDKNYALEYLHLWNRRAKEMEYFGEQTPDFKYTTLTTGELNTPESAQMVKEAGAYLVLIFGCGMIREPLMSALPGTRINLHLGLSPRYRGAATLFWPFYFLEPNWAGCTFHQIVAEPDAGEILHQSVPALERGDTIHDAACRAVLTATEDMLELLDRWPDWTYRKQRNTGKCFLASDFQAAHLRTIYETWGDAVVDAYLDGVINAPEPKLYRDNINDRKRIAYADIR